jgi:hypothetical protein
MEATLYVCGRLLVDAMGATPGPVAVTLAMSAEDVQLSVTAPTDESIAGDNRRQHALRLLGDRVAVLGGDVATTSFEQITEIRCHVPLGADSEDAQLRTLAAR